MLKSLAVCLACCDASVVRCYAMPHARCGVAPLKQFDPIRTAYFPKHPLFYNEHDFETHSAISIRYVSETDENAQKLFMTNT